MSRNVSLQTSSKRTHVMGEWKEGTGGGATNVLDGVVPKIVRSWWWLCILWDAGDTCERSTIGVLYFA